MNICGQWTVSLATRNWQYFERADIWWSKSNKLALELSYNRSRQLNDQALEALGRVWRKAGSLQVEDLECKSP
jgi:hypothetical protein